MYFVVFWNISDSEFFGPFTSAEAAHETLDGIIVNAKWTWAQVVHMPTAGEPVHLATRSIEQS